MIKFTGDFSALYNRVHLIEHNRQMGVWNMNLTLFDSILRYWNKIGRLYQFICLVGNVIAFVPLGYLLPRVFRRCRSLPVIFSYCFVIILGIETFQLVSMLGYFDVDDILLNMTGSLLGYALFWLQGVLLGLRGWVAACRVKSAVGAVLK